VLEEVLAAGCTSVWCLGDLVGYGADPEPCVALVRAHADVCLAGNHDLGVVGALSVSGFSDPARLAAEWTAAALSDAALAFLRELSPSATGQAAALYHGSPRDPIWEYILGEEQARLAVEASPSRVTIVGHTHVALAYGGHVNASLAGGTRHAGERLAVGSGRWLLNPGSVGQPRDGDPRAAWLELDTESWLATFRRVAYDIPRAAAAIRHAGLPEALAERLSHGQ
jgi:diadenosine tetraphosphatase ApaH/serine/threonine PP2A family protein phosphatase